MKTPLDQRISIPGRLVWLVSLILALVITSCKHEVVGVPGPLRISEANPRYFADPSGKVVYLTGSHTWDNLIDMNDPGKLTPFDYAAYLQFMKGHHQNFMRMWRWELLTFGLTDYVPAHEIPLHPWLRNGDGKAIDGQPKFDLTKFNPDYFKRLRERVIAAGEEGIYVSVMLFEGWGVQFSEKGYVNHPFHALNNVNNLGLDTANAKRLTMYTMENSVVTEIQEQYVRQVVETIGDLDNVLYEISNENHGGSTEWQYHMINFIRDMEKDRGKSHPVGMTFQYKGGTNANLFNSPADWVSPNPDGGYNDDPPIATGSKVVVPDTDHLWGIGGTVAWVWKSFFRGMNPIFMDPYKDDVFVTHQNAAWDSVRVAMGRASLLATQIDLGQLQPDTAFSSSRYALVNKGNEYVVYLPHETESSIDLSGVDGVFQVSWLDTATGNKQEGDALNGGTSLVLSSPFSTVGSIVHLRKE